MSQESTYPKFFVAWLVAFAPTALARLLLDPFLPPVRMENPLGLINLSSVLVLSPVLETLLLAGLLRFGLRFTQNAIILSFSSGAFWAVLHGLFSPHWGAFVFWPFVVFSYCFLRWFVRSRRSAVIYSILLHAAHNAAGLVCYVLLYRDGVM